MNVLTKPANRLPVGVAAADCPASLRAFLEPHCPAAIWQRHTPAEVQAWLNALDPVNDPGEDI